MLANGAGALVPHSDSEGMATALRSVLSEPGVAIRMATEAASIGSTLYWPVVADRYESIAGDLVDRRSLVDGFPSGRRAVALAKVG